MKCGLKVLFIIPPAEKYNIVRVSYPFFSDEIEKVTLRNLLHCYHTNSKTMTTHLITDTTKQKRNNLTIGSVKKPVAVRSVSQKQQWWFLLPSEESFREVEKR